MTLRVGDVVRTTAEPVETWLLACDEEHGRVLVAGWPCTLADVDGLELVEPATDEERIAMLRQCAAMADRGDSRCLAAVRQLEAAP